MRSIEQLTNPVGYLVRLRREAKRHTQQEVADNSGLTRTYIAMLERGDRKSPTLVHMASIAMALDLDPQDVLDAGKQLVWLRRNERKQEMLRIAASV